MIAPTQPPQHRRGGVVDALEQPVGMHVCMPPRLTPLSSESSS
eukprot:COSAG01_NODE_6805_length_3497_cov_117.941922_5_plen_43_part_00